MRILAPALGGQSSVPRTGCFCTGSTDSLVRRPAISPAARRAPSLRWRRGQPPIPWEPMEITQWIMGTAMGAMHSEKISFSKTTDVAQMTYAAMNCQCFTVRFGADGWKLLLATARGGSRLSPLGAPPVAGGRKLADSRLCFLFQFSR